MIFLPHSQEATEAHDGKHDVIGQLVENDVLDLANLLAGQILDARADYLLRANRVGACSANSHNLTLMRCEPRQCNESTGAMFRRAGYISRHRHSNASLPDRSQRSTTSSVWPKLNLRENRRRMRTAAPSGISVVRPSW